MVVHIDTNRYNRPCLRCGANVHGVSAAQCPSCGWSMTPACIGCGYDLTGLARDAACPECGTPVARSYAPDRLENRSGAYLAQLSSGLKFVIAGTLCSLGVILLTIPAFIVAEAVWSSSDAAERVVRFVGEVLGLLCSAAVLLGWWWITTPDPARVGTDLDVAPRRIVRTTVLIQIAGEVLGAATTGLSVSIPSLEASVGMESLLGAVSLVAAIAWAVQFFAAMLYIRWLARRIPDPGLEGRAKQLTWLGPVLFVLGWPCLGIGPLIALILYLGLLVGLRRTVVRVLASAA